MLTVHYVLQRIATHTEQMGKCRFWKGFTRNHNDATGRKCQTSRNWCKSCSLFPFFVHIKLIDGRTFWDNLALIWVLGMWIVRLVDLSRFEIYSFWVLNSSVTKHMLIFMTIFIFRILEIILSEFLLISKSLRTWPTCTSQLLSYFLKMQSCM